MLNPNFIDKKLKDHLSLDDDPFYKFLFTYSGAQEGKFYIYKLTCLINNKIYIGQTNNPYQRYFQYRHVAKYMYDEQVINRAILKHGFHNFHYEVISMCLSLDDLNFTEIELIKQYNARDMTIGYNIDEGGKGVTMSLETRAKISAGLNKFYETHSGSMLGRKHTEESKKNMSEASMGKPGTNTGKPHSAEWNAKIALANTGKKPSAETLKKLSDSHMGKIPPNRKLTDDQVREIRRLFNEEKVKIAELARNFNIAETTMGAIVKMWTYKNVL